MLDWDIPHDKHRRLATEWKNCHNVPKGEELLFDDILDRKYNFPELRNMQQKLAKDQKVRGPRFNILSSVRDLGVMLVPSMKNPKELPVGDEVDNTLQHYMDNIWVYKKMHDGIVYRGVFYQHEKKERVIAPNQFTLLRFFEHDGTTGSKTNEYNDFIDEEYVRWLS